MTKPKFPGSQTDLPDIDTRLPNFALKDGVLVLNDKPSGIQTIDGDHLILIESLLAHLDELSESTKNTNSSSYLAIRIEQLKEQLAKDKIAENQVRLGLLLSSFRIFAEAVLKEGFASYIIEAQLASAASIAARLEGGLSEWRKFELRSKSFEVTEEDSRESRVLFKRVVDVLEEAADLVSVDVIEEVSSFENKVSSNHLADHHYSVARLAITNNLLVSILKELKTQNEKKGNWILKHVGRQIFMVIQSALSLQVGKKILGWVNLSVARINELFKD